MINHIKVVCLLLLMVMSFSGCSLLRVALSAGAAYGIYQATKK